MKRSIGLWQLVGFAVTSLFGTILHFLYEWLGNPTWIAPFSGVNESTWEHMKLLFWPMLTFAVMQSFFFRDRSDFWCVKLRGILLGIFLIPIVFYTYNGVIGKSPDWINITIFYITAVLVFLFEWWAIKKEWLQCRHPQLAFAAICLIGALFVVFTFAPPQIPLFQDPLTK